MEIRIENGDGFTHNTHIIDARTGEELAGVTGIVVRPLVMRRPRIEADVSLSLVGLSLLAHANIYIECPHCRARILIDSDSLPSRGGEG